MIIDEIFTIKIEVVENVKKVIFTIKEFNNINVKDKNIYNFINTTRYVPFSLWFIHSFYNWVLWFSYVNINNKYLNCSNFRKFLSNNTNIDKVVMELLEFLEKNKNENFIFIKSELESKIIYFLLQHVWDWNLNKYIINFDYMYLDYSNIIFINNKNKNQRTYLMVKKRNFIKTDIFNLFKNN